MQKAQASGETQIATIQEAAQKNIEAAELEGSNKVESLKSAEAKLKAKEDNKAAAIIMVVRRAHRPKARSRGVCVLQAWQ